MAALQRSDFDLIHKTISISKSVEYVGRYIPHVKGTKNDKTRVIPLLAQMESLLADWLATAELDDFLIGGKAPLPRSKTENVREKVREYGEKFLENTRKSVKNQ